MKHKFLIAASIGLVVLSSCLKDKGTNLADQQSASPNIVEFADVYKYSASAQALFAPLVLEVSSTPLDVDIYVRLASSNGSNPAVDVSVAKNIPAVAAAGYGEFLPDSTYQIVSTSASVDRTTNIATIKLKVFTNKINLSGSYALAFDITSASNGAVIASNRRTLVLGVAVKNQYDGIYEQRGSMLRAGDPVLSGPVGPREVSLSTFNANTVKWLGPKPWANGSGSALPGGYEPLITVNSDNSISLASVGGIGGWMMYAAYNNHYDVPTRTMYYSFTWGAGPASRLSIDTLRYLRPRP